LSWLVEKFNPPGWEGALNRLPEQPDFAGNYFTSFSRKPSVGTFPWSFPTWKGLPVIKYPDDMLFYAQLIHANKPDFLVETGTERGGSAHFFADVMDLAGHGRVVTVDKVDYGIPTHPRITSIIGRATTTPVLEQVRALVGDGSVMVSLDANHARSYVKRELGFYAPFVTKGQYLVVEDCYPENVGPLEAVKWWLLKRRPFAIMRSNYILSLNVWLKRQ